MEIVDIVHMSTRCGYQYICHLKGWREGRHLKKYRDKFAHYIGMGTTS